MKPIPTKVHGALDYATAALLLALPRLLHWDKTLTRRVQIAAVGTALYSAVTRYEWGVPAVKLLPMPGHLALDAASGALFCAAPLLLPDEPPPTQALLVGIGLFELLVTSLSQSQPANGEH